MKKWISFSLLLCLNLCFWTACDTSTSTPSSNSSSGDNDAIDAKVTALMAKMDITDKVGEMTQLSLDMLMVGEPYNIPDPQTLDTAKMRKALVDLRVGSILNVAGYALSRERWHEIIGEIQKLATQEKSSGIPVIYGIDAIHGTNYTTRATLFPQQITQAASWDPEIAREISEITAYECRASAIPWAFSPVLDLGRDPRWPRLWEGYGEDVHLATQMGVASIEGFQGESLSDQKRVAACMKHFTGYSMPRNGHDRTPAYIPERQLREYFLPTFQAAIDAGAATVMINSAEMNGIPVHANSKILVDILRKEMGFKGLAVTDWTDIRYLVDRHKVAKDYKEAIKMSINAGIDMSMVPVDLEFPILLKELVEEGEVPMSRIDEAVRRILRLKFELGLFESPLPPFDDYPEFASEANIAKSLETAQECLTLLKNEEDILPISKQSRVLVTGPTANNMASLNGGWTNTWQGRDAKHDTPGKLTLVEAIKAKIGEDRVNYVEGTRIEIENNAHIDKAINIGQAVTAARRSDVAIICLGELSYTEHPGDINDLTLPLPQQQLVQAIAKTGTPIVLVLLEGRPRIISTIEEMADGVLLGYYPGNEGAAAIANVLFGDHNPSGKLPYTYPRYANDLLHYDHKYTERLKVDYSFNHFNPQYEFGHGLSYTKFAYSDLQLSSGSMGMDGEMTISVKVKNEGERAGKEVVQLYISDLVASITPSFKRLRGFEKIDLAPGAEQVVEFKITAKDLAFVGIDQQWITEPGEFKVNIGGLEKTFTIE